MKNKNIAHICRKQLSFYIISLLLSACFISGCQFNPLLEKDSDNYNHNSESNTTPTLNGEMIITPTKATDIQTDEIQLPQFDQYYSYLTGNPTLEAKANKRPIAICIGNTSSSLPQYGLSYADIMIEAPVEGGSTRLMAITQNYLDVTCYGSVRSTRDYLLTIANSFDSISVYAGTSDNNINNHYAIDGDTLDYISQNLSSSFYRDSSRNSPHNLMTSGELLHFAIEDSGFSIDTSTKKLPYQISLNKSKEVTERKLNATSIELPFSSIQKTNFTYDPIKNIYLRYQNNAAHIDALNRTQLSYTNLILIFCDSSTKNTSGNTSLTMHLTGEGLAYYISEGKASQISWKTLNDSSIYLTDNSGQPLVILPGKTYIGLIRTSSMESILME